MLVSLALILVGFVLLIGGADALVRGASTVAERLGMSQRVIGLTVVAIGTAAPELVVSIASAMEGHADMAYGNVAGSCMANLLLILGLSAVIAPVGLSRLTQRFEIPASAISILLMLVLSNTDGELNAWEGAVLCVAFVAFVAYTVYVDMRQEEPEAAAPEDDAVEPSGEDSLVLALAFIVGGIVALKFGADFVVEHASLVAAALGLSERIIGLTVVALGTCLPELVTSVMAAFRGNTDIAVGNVVGSNITNVLLVLGAPALLAPIAYESVYNIDFLLLTIFTVALVGVAFIGVRHEMSRRNGVVFVMFYVIYIVASVLAV